MIQNIDPITVVIIISGNAMKAPHIKSSGLQNEKPKSQTE